MLKAKGKIITMTEGDYGLTLPITINGAVFEKNDEIKIIIKENVNGKEIFSKSYKNIENNIINFGFTKKESELLSPKYYVYIMDWYREETFLCNIIKDGKLLVEDKW